MKTLFTLILGLFLFSAPASAQLALPDWKTVDIKVTHVAGSVYMIEGFGGNIGVSAGPDGLLIVDDEYAPLTGRIRAAIAKFSKAPVRFVINTHWHPDHVGGNANLKAAGGIVIAQDNTREHILAFIGNKNLRPDEMLTADHLPIITFEKRTTLHFNSDDAEVIHIRPAHTDGDAIVFFRKANVIHTGDGFFHGFYPFIDVAAGGSIDGMIGFYDALYAMANADTKIIPGHGPLANREDVRVYQAMLKTVRERVWAAIEAGETIDSLIARKPLADLDPEWGGNLIKADGLLRMVWADLERLHK